MAITVPAYLRAAGVTPGPECRHYGRVSGKRNRLIVIHDAETPETARAAENVAAWGSRTPVLASWDFMVDVDSTLMCVPWPYTAWGAPGVNGEAVHVEQAGYASQSRAQWLDAYSRTMLERSARLVAAICKGSPDGPIPPVRLTTEHEARTGTGILGHDLISRTFGGTHWDPGPGFPWDYFMGRVEFYHGATDTVTPPTPPKPVNGVYVVRRGDTLGGIARALKTTVSNLVEWNRGLIRNPNVIRPGWKLRTAPPAPKARPRARNRDRGHGPNSSGQVRIMRPGDTLAAYAGAWNVSLAAILKANPGIVDPARLPVGFRVYLPW